MKISFHNIYKCLQRKYYDLISSHKISLVLVIFVIFLIFLFLNFSGVWFWYETVNYMARFGPYSRTIIGKPYHHSYFHPAVPIDVVYTWVNGSDPVFLQNMQAALGGVDDDSVHNDSTASRYRDKEELRYSLRSLEKWAPWVRHIYIVTNGQIPYWLDVESVHITVVTHHDIFPNHEDLPTFSSPAIEAHLHRIPGLSELFLYFNDDILLGKEIWLDDFVTLSKGYKVFLSWNVPDCSNECPWAWVGDGACDPPCNNYRCDFDFGDCERSSSNSFPKHIDIPTNVPIVKDRDPDILLEVEKVEQYFKELTKSPPNMKKNKFKSEKLSLSDTKTTGKLKKSYSLRHSLESTINKSFPLINQNSSLFSKRPLESYITNVGSRNNLENSVINFKLRRKLLNQEPVIVDEDVKKILTSETKFNSDNRRIMNLLKNKNISEAIKINNSQYLEQKRYRRRILKQRTRKPKEAPVLNANGKTVVDVRGIAELLANNQSKLNISYAMKPEWSEVNTSSSYRENSLDMFGESLLFVHKLYNKVFGLKNRKVPAHMPHLFNKTIMTQLQNRFAEEWRNTSRHKFRHKNDMQLAFSYYHFLLSLSSNRTVNDVFDEFDTDNSGTWSDREIRTVLTKLYGTPLTLQAVLEFETILKNCSKKLDVAVLGTPAPYDRYSDSQLPTVSRGLIQRCASLVEAFAEEFPARNVFKTELVYDKQQDGIFKGLVNNLSIVLNTLDYIRANQKKFICINDNIASKQNNSDEDIIVAVLHDFYESLYPHASKFELPAYSRNRFSNITDYLMWKESRRLLIAWILAAFLLAVLGTLCILYKVEINASPPAHEWIKFFRRCKGGCSLCLQKTSELNNSIQQL